MVRRISPFIANLCSKSLPVKTATLTAAMVSCYTKCAFAVIRVSLHCYWQRDSKLLFWLLGYKTAGYQKESEEEEVERS